MAQDSSHPPELETKMPRGKHLYDLNQLLPPMDARAPPFVFIKIFMLPFPYSLLSNNHHHLLACCVAAKSIRPFNMFCIHSQHSLFSEPCVFFSSHSEKPKEQIQKKSLSPVQHRPCHVAPVSWPHSQASAMYVLSPSKWCGHDIVSSKQSMNQRSTPKCRAKVTANNLYQKKIGIFCFFPAVVIKTLGFKDSL